MSRTLSYEPEAEAELETAIGWYEDQQAGLGLELVEEVEAAGQRIAENPKIASLAPCVPERLGARRLLLHRFPYALVYFELDEQTLSVVAVAHLKRKPGYWIDRLPT